MVEYMGIGSYEQSFLHAKVRCLLGYSSSFCLKKVFDPSSNPNLLLTRRLIVFESACENPQPMTKIAIERGL